MGEREAEEARLRVLLKTAADHLNSEAESVPEFRAELLECRTRIEECRLKAQRGPMGSDLWYELWSIFGTSLDWDHLARDFRLGDEILSIIERFYFKHQTGTSGL